MAEIVFFAIVAGAAAGKSNYFLKFFVIR